MGKSTDGQIRQKPDPGATPPPLSAPIYAFQNLDPRLFINLNLSTQCVQGFDTHGGYIIKNIELLDPTCDGYATHL